MPSAVAIDALTKHFGPVVAVDDLSLSVEEGEVFGFLGPNGAGKTTTIRSMLGFITPTRGSVALLGSAISRDPGPVLERIGSLPGEFGLWHGLDGNQVLDYLAALNPRPARRRADLLDRFQLSGRDLGRPVRTYSRGMRQKLGLVQAFQHEPELVILDEPTEGLDPLMQERFLELISSFRDAGGTVFMSSHILSEVEAIASRVGVIKQGRLLKLGRPADLAGEHLHVARLVLRDPEASLEPLERTEGVEGLSHEGATVRLAIRGEIGPALRALGDLELMSCTVEPPRLSDAFLELYREGG